MPINRRQFFQLGAASLMMACGFSSLGSYFVKQEIVAGQSVVQPKHLPVLRALIQGFLDTALPNTGRTAAIEEAINAFVKISKTLTPTAQADLGQLLDILENPLGRLLIANLNHDWEMAPTSEVQNFLISFRDHPIPALQPGYHILHDITMTGWYSLPSQWIEMGYPGPPSQAS
jgi:hypothetical protein